jgi:hypothetical protein
MTRAIGGQMRLRAVPATMQARAVTIGTNRLPEKNPRYAGRLMRKYLLNSHPAMLPTTIPPNTPVSMDWMPIIAFGSYPSSAPMTPIVPSSTT